jgi:hypothetical protein
MKTNELTKPTREKTSVAIQGLDTSSPNDIAKDGTCEKLHNIRFKDSAWRPVHKHSAKAVLLDDIVAEFDIVYHHPAAGENTYIARYKDEPETFATITFHEDEQPTTNAFATVPKVVEISHFGNILIFDIGTSLVYYMLRNNEYHKVTFPPYARLSISNLSISSPEPNTFWAEYSNPYRVESYPYSLDKESSVIQDGGSIFEYITDITNYTKGESLLPVNEGSNWRGEILLFSTWQLEDGTNVAPSPLLLVHSSITPDVYSGESHVVSVVKNEDTKEEILRLSNRKGKSTLPFNYKTSLLASVLPTLDIRISKDWDYSNIKSLVVWATRIHPTFELNIPSDPVDYQKAKERFWFADNNLADQPFYKYAELDVSMFVDDPTNDDDSNIPEDPEQDPNDGYIDDEYDPSEGWYPEFDDRDDGYDDWGAYALSARAPRGTTKDNLLLSLTITRQSLESAINNKRYKPNNNAHLLFASRPYDYNNRFHYFDYKQVLAKGYHISDSNNPVSVEASRSFSEWVEVEVDGKTYNVVSSSTKNGLSLLGGTPMSNVISYPDVRATRYSVEEHFSKLLTPAYANGFAWFMEKPTQYAKFPPIAIDEGILTGDNLPIDSSVVRLSNRVQVTSSNNLFSIPFENNYVVGSRNNRILALQSAAIEMHEMKVGELPLYAFTEEGIFALVAGSETLYASVAAINYDKIINPNTLAINGAIVYITEKGVHLLTSQGTQVISTPIHSADGMPPLDFLRTCKIIHPKQYNEIVLLNEDSAEGIAYVFNLDAAYWSTRDLKGRKLNTDELYNGNTIYDLADEDESKALPIEISTRPIKLGNVEFKRLETIIPRMSTNDKMVVLNMDVDGSVDGHSYSELRKVVNMELEPHRTNPITLRRTPFSAKYFKCHMLMEPELGETFNPSITHIDLEWYLRFVRRMR